MGVSPLGDKHGGIPLGDKLWSDGPQGLYVGLSPLTTYLKMPKILVAVHDN